ncbi:hypothetical protein [Aeromonas taiwanensis]|uniref:hypothetical protein n=1 Tax=Aeromonas taiwanensis TaxID=633417 RepID=UPI001E39833D|nr:hypothetical protein [Aeromonas taiwanensis]
MDDAHIRVSDGYYRYHVDHYYRHYDDHHHHHRDRYYRERDYRDHYDGHHHGGYRSFCPPGQAKKGRC